MRVLCSYFQEQSHAAKYKLLQKELEQSSLDQTAPD